ncbi:MAG: glutamate synthase subunit beta [Actinomycetota bacterium]|nr:glutamate synthase subunit beta [Actinomycetota bacterium]
MGELGAFLRIERVDNPERDPRERRNDYHEFIEMPPVPQLQEQGARCMECGVPFCHNGCPLGNLIPDWNDLVYRDRWREAIDQLHATNNFPEFTGKLCPAPCEAACVLEIREGDAVTIKQIEVAIVNRAFEEGWVAARPPLVETGRTVAVIGAGPAGLAAAQQLRRAGHHVTVYERDEAGGGLVRFGVPDFKIEKWVVERRLEQLAAEGVRFEYGTDVGVDVGADELRERHDAVVLATGSRVPRDLPVPGRELAGVHYAMEYLYGRNRWVAAGQDGESPVTAAGKHVIVIGGGDTGADCVGNAHREAAASVTQIELLGEPPARRPDDMTPWPRWPVKLRTSYALKEGGDRDFAISTTKLTGEHGQVKEIHWVQNSGVPPFDPVPGTESSHPADLVLLAMGFLYPEPAVLEQLGVERDQRGNAKAGAYATSVPGVFAAGDARRGQSLIVWAINEGRQCARVADRYLRDLPAGDPREALTGQGVTD